MATNPPPNFCPYKGLQPYTEADRPYFFGRERDQEIITSNLYAAPLTVLYGASGVGKTSVLLAGVVPQLRETPRLAVVVFRAWQDEGFLDALKAQTLDATQKSLGKPFALDLNLPFDDFVNECTKALRGSLFFILDQFEEYFLYHMPMSEESGFDAEFARAVNRREVAANFLVALREDGLSRLDRFKGRIPNLLGNLLRLEHLDHDAAVSAIRNPLTEYNRQARTQMSVEDALVEKVIEQVKAGSVALGAGGIGQIVRADETRVETPYLQLVLTRLWEEERRAKSTVLRRTTFERLGGAQQIVRTHLDATMQHLPGSEREVAARAFRYLVTPSQTKIAYTLPDLANYADVPQTKLEPVLKKLADPNVRVLRSVAPATGEKKEIRYEIFHDVLAPAVLDWRERYQEKNRVQRVRTFAALVVPIILIALAFSILQSFRAESAQSQVQVAQAAVQVAQAQVTAAQAQATVVQSQVDATLVRVEATQVAQTKVLATQAQEIAQVATQAAVAAVDSYVQQNAQATRTEAVRVATVSQQVLRTPSPTFSGRTPEPTQVAAQATAASNATSAAQVLNFKVTNVRADITPDVLATCPLTVSLQGLITVNQPGAITYRWERSDGASMPLVNLTLSAAGTRTVTDTWAIGYLASGWARLKIVSPESMQSAQVTFASKSSVPNSLQSELEKNYKVSLSLGCPRGSASRIIDGRLQQFQNGWMIWRDDTKQIYVLSNDGAWAVYPDTWNSSQPEGGYFKPPSEKLYEPLHGFGKVWREQLGADKAKIGWATDKQEAVIRSQIQQFDHGFAFIINDGKDFKILFEWLKWADL